MECWSTKIETIKATNVTTSTTKPEPHSMPLDAKFVQVGFPDAIDPESRRLVLGLLENANVLRNELLNPNLLPGLLGNSQ